MPIAYSQLPIAGFALGETEPHPDGNGLVAVRKPNGKYLCVTPEGAVEERDSPGAWEGFRKGASSLVAEREGNRVYVLTVQ